MIKKVKLTGFQKHEVLNVKFKKGLNVIVGETDSGKSSLFRALKFALFNQAKDVNFINHNCKEAIVEVEINGLMIKRLRSKSKNFYWVDGCKLVAFGAGVPDEVECLTEMEDINIQSQHDPAFLLSQTPGQVAKYLNKLINLDVIDVTMSKLNSDCSTANKEIKSHQQLEAGYIKEIDEEKWVDEAVTAFDKIEQGLSELEDGSVHVFSLTSLISASKDAKKKVEEGKVDKAAFKRLEGWSQEICAYEDDIKLLKSLINKMKNKPVLINMELISGVTSSCDKLLKVSIKRERLQKAFSYVSDLTKERYARGNALQVAEEELAELGFCPTCERKL